MSIKGLFAFIRREKIPGASKILSVEDLVRDINEYQREFNKNAKILIVLQAFTCCYEHNVKDTFFGGRLNSMKSDFEVFLSTLKDAGADLMFVSKWTEFLNAHKSNERYDRGLNFVYNLQEIRSVKELVSAYEAFRSCPWDRTATLVLAQSAKKFGVFRENECNTLNNRAGHAKTATEEDCYAVIGLTANYLLYEGSWRFLYFAHSYNEYGHIRKVFTEYNKDAFMKFYDLSMDQMQLFGIIAGKFSSSFENENLLAGSFAKIRSYKYKFGLIVDFIHRHAPREEFPLQEATVKNMLREIYGYVVADTLESFMQSLPPLTPMYVEKNENISEEINELLRHNPYSYMAQRILNNLSFLIESYVLDVAATDMKSLKDLTLPWVKRACGVLFKNIENPQICKVHYRVDVENWEDVEILPEYPDFEIPSLTQLLEHGIGSDTKFKMLAFLVDNLIAEDEFKDIPTDFLMHDILVKYLVENDSMKQAEACALNKTVKEKAPRFLIYPLDVNVRLFRISTLYRKMFEVLVYSLYACGLEELIAELKLDSVLFQINFSDMNDDNNN